MSKKCKVELASRVRSLDNDPFGAQIGKIGKEKLSFPLLISDYAVLRTRGDFLLWVLFLFSVGD